MGATAARGDVAIAAARSCVQRGVVAGPAQRPIGAELSVQRDAGGEEPDGEGNDALVDVRPAQDGPDWMVSTG